MVRRLHKLFLRTNLSKQDNVKTFYSNFLQIKRVLKILGGNFSNRQLFNLFRRIKTKQRLIALYKAFFFRCDFFLTKIGFAISGNQARQWITHGHMLINGHPLTEFAASIKIKDVVGLSSKIYHSSLFKRAWVRRHMLEIFGVMPRMFFSKLCILKKYEQNRRKGLFRFLPDVLMQFEPVVSNQFISSSFTWNRFWSTKKLGVLNTSYRLLNLQASSAPGRNVFTPFNTENPWFLEDGLFLPYADQKLNGIYKCNLSSEARVQIVPLIKVLYPCTDSLPCYLKKSNIHKLDDIDYVPTIEVLHIARMLGKQIRKLILNVHYKRTKSLSTKDLIDMNPKIWNGNFVRLGRVYQVLVKLRQHEDRASQKLIEDKLLINKPNISSRRRLLSRLRIWHKKRNFSFIQYHLRTCSVFVRSNPTSQTLPSFNNFDLNDLNQLRFIL